MPRRDRRESPGLSEAEEEKDRDERGVDPLLSPLPASLLLGVS
jgi:hypothetical protein